MQKELDIYYKNLLIPRKYKPDLTVENKFIVELKATQMRVGLLLNFGKKSVEVKRRIL